jgi:LAO/AO transport system kinase
MTIKRPEWVPENGGNAYTTNVMKGVEGGHDGMTAQTSQRVFTVNHRPEPSVDNYVEGVISGDRTMLGRAITLVESNASRHIDTAQEVLRRLLPHTGRSVRVGITGVPGAGKSTFIEAFGTYLTKQDHRLAVLAIDPSSTLTRGSILGDKTRMESLSREPRCFIRPSPSGGTLGGVTRKTRETILVCEAAGFDIILVETVGVGQSEVTVRSMVDFFLLLHVAGTGDELQGIKRGVMELSDAVAVNKADGDNRLHAERAANMLANVLGFLAPYTPGWQPPALTCSALDGTGIEEIWAQIQAYVIKLREHGLFDSRRHEQDRLWMREMLNENLLSHFYRHPDIELAIKDVEHAVLKGEIPVTKAVQLLLNRWREINK